VSNTAPSTPSLYTLSLHDALPIYLFKVVIQRTLMTSSQFVDDIVVKKFAVSHKNGIVKNEFNVRYQVCSYDHQRVWPHSCDDRIQSGVTSGRVDPADWQIGRASCRERRRVW